MYKFEPLLQLGYRPETVILADGSYPVGIGLELLNSCQYVVCCDGAADAFVERGGVPMAIVGDCDSVSEQTRSKFEDIVCQNPDQQSNDLTKAVDFCVSRGRTDIIIVGATGKRDDHTIGNISLLVDYMEVVRVKMVTDHGVFTPIDSTTMFQSFPGQQVSLFSLDPHTTVTTINLRYPLKNSLLPSWWRGTLNEALSDQFGFEVYGKSIIFQRFDEK